MAVVPKTIAAQQALIYKKFAKKKASGISLRKVNPMGTETIPKV